MPLESATFISSLIASNPPGSDLQSQGDDHFRLVKAVLQNTFPNANRAFYFPSAKAKTANYTVLAADDRSIITGDASGGAFTFTLPSLFSVDKGWEVWIVKIDTSLNAIAVDPGGTINGQAEVRLTIPWEVQHILWTGSNFVSADRAVTQYVPYTIKVADYTVLAEDFGKLLYVIPTALTTLTLPNAVNFDGTTLAVKVLADGFNVVINPNGAHTIDGAGTKVLNGNGAYAVLHASGGDWITLYTGNSFSLTDVTNTWTKTQTFINASLILSPQVLTDAATIAWNMDHGNNARVTLGADRVLGNPTNAVAGLFGWLEVNSGGFQLTYSANFTWLSIVPILPNGRTILQYYVVNPTTIYIWAVKQGANFTAYDLGAVAHSHLYSQAHGLATYPTDVAIFLENTTGEWGYSVGDRLKITGWVGFNSSGGSDFNTSMVPMMSTTTVSFATSADDIAIPHKTTGAIVTLTPGNWKVILRIYQ